jgi:hypothetical protein
MMEGYSYVVFSVRLYTNTRDKLGIGLTNMGRTSNVKVQ